MKRFEQSGHERSTTQVPCSQSTRWLRYVFTPPCAFALALHFHMTQNVRPLGWCEELVYMSRGLRWFNVVLTLLCISPYFHPSIHSSTPLAILSSVKSYVNLQFPFMLTSKMGTHMQMHNPSHFSQHTHTHTRRLTLSHLPLMSCYPACWTLAPCGLNPVWQPITWQWGGPWPRQPAQHSPAAFSIDGRRRICAAVGCEEHGGRDVVKGS